MRRFITYLYEYRDGEKMNNAGFIRVDVRGSVVQMMLNIKTHSITDARGEFVLYIKDIKGENVFESILEEIILCKGAYDGRYSFDLKEKNISLEDIIGVALEYEDGTYMASCWRDGEEGTVAKRNTCVPRNQAQELKASEAPKDEVLVSNLTEDIYQMTTYCKINLNEIHSLHHKHWHYGNNSFLIHGFWNYGYLVLKENLEENKKRVSLGVPGIYEEPEMVMATYFGFPRFEILPTQVVQMEVGEKISVLAEKENQQAQEHILGCWFVEL